MRALEETPSYTVTRPVPQTRSLGSMHIPVTDPYEGITDEQIMAIALPCGIMLGDSGSIVVDSLRMMDQDRASECSTVEAS